MKSNYVLFLVYFQTCLWLLCYFDVTIFTGIKSAIFIYCIPPEWKHLYAVCVWGGCPCHRPPKQWFQSFCKYCVFPPNDLWSPMEDLRGFHRYHYLEGAHRRWERGCQRLEICHLPTSATNPFRIYVAAIHFRNELNLSNDEFGLELDRRQLPPLQLQTMPTGWQALPLMRKVRGPSRRDWQSIPEYPSPAGHDWVLAQRDLQNFPGELMGQSGPPVWNAWPPCITAP